MSVSPAKGDKPETLEHRNKRREENTKSEENLSYICGYDDIYVFQFRWINLEKFVFIKTELVLPFFLSKVAYINPHIQI
jgi:hypothetical protein